MDAFEYGLTIAVVVLWAGFSMAESELPVFKIPPTIKIHNGKSITICWKRWSPTSDKGHGTPVAYRIDINDEHGSWRELKKVEANDWSEQNEGFEITLPDIQTNVSRFLRIVIVDQSGEAETHDVPSVHIRPASQVLDNQFNVTTKDVGNNVENFSLKAHMEEWLIWIGIAAGGALITAVLIVIVIECTKKNRMKTPRNNEYCLELVENNANGSGYANGLENPGYVTLRSETMRSCRSTKSDKKVPAKTESSKEKNSKHRKTRSNQMVSTLCSQGKQKSDNRSSDDAADSRYPRDSDGSWYTEWYDSRTYENQGAIDSCRAPSIMKHFSSCQEKY